MLQKFFLAFLALGLILFGIIIGIITQKIFYSEEKAQEIQIIKKDDSTVPTIELVAIENGILKGKILSAEEKSISEIQIRIIQKDQKIEMINSDDGNDFEINILPIFPMAKILPHPEGKKFVASKRGKNYWLLDSPQAFLISPKNRIFFNSEADAQENKYRKGR